ncbi:hypothetical protein [Streptomyces sp. 184]|uniref:hypothetical protein n=1 Tax=Streptomyces sp. 184 TaxID=1827526 RepID=UPI003892C16E
MTAKELQPGDWRRAVYGRSQITGTTRRRAPLKADKERIITKQGYVCLYCEIPLSTVIRRGRREITLKVNWDHFVPYAYSLRNPSDNWVLACHVCNGIKLARMFDSVEAARQAILPERIAKGYESPREVFHRLGLQREQHIALIRPPRPTDRQLKALEFAAAGLGSLEIARELQISPSDAADLLIRACHRLGVANRRDAIELAVLHGYIAKPTHLESEAP